MKTENKINRRFLMSNEIYYINNNGVYLFCIIRPFETYSQIFSIVMQFKYFRFKMKHFSDNAKENDR